VCGNCLVVFFVGYNNSSIFLFKIFLEWLLEIFFENKLLLVGTFFDVELLIWHVLRTYGL
jgi:hypothetical protein